MRYLFGFVGRETVVRKLILGMVLAGLAALPLSVSAQAGETTSEPNLKEPLSSSESAPEEPALKLELDSVNVDVTPSPPRTFDGYTLEELELRKRRAAFGLIAPAAVAVAGVVLLVRGTTGDCAYEEFEPWPEWCNGPYASGIALTTAGGVGMIITSILVGVRKQELNLAVHDYTLEEVELRVKRAKIGLYVSGGAFLVGLVMTAAGFASYDFDASLAPAWTGVALMTGGFFGMIITGSMLRVRNRKLRQLQEAHYGRPRKVQWDPAQWRFLF